MGPAKETTASSLRIFLKLFLLTGTGLAQPIMKEDDANDSRGIRTLPIRSICFMGFRLRRPWRFAVSSPNFDAKKAWENSWKASEIKNTGRNSRKFISLSFT